MRTNYDFITLYVAYCHEQKRLDLKTIRAYSIDLKQLSDYFSETALNELTCDDIETYICFLNKQYKAKTVKRKIASVKAFFHYLEYKEYIAMNPFHKVHFSLREPITLPKTIPLHTIEKLFQTIYQQAESSHTSYQQKKALRDAAVCELLFATGMRISELCALTPSSIDLLDKSVLIYGKGAKERKIQIGNPEVVKVLIKYQKIFQDKMEQCNHFFVNPSGGPLTDQAVRRMLNHYTELASIEQHITPHMFRHTFASGLLDADVDIRYIQKMLGHSSIHTTEIYTHVTMAKQKDILTNKHPRNMLHLA